MMDNTYYQNLRYEGSTSSKPINLNLIFSNEVASPVFTTQYITAKADGDDGNKSIKLILLDSNTNETITTGPLASSKVKIVLLRADYCGSTTKDFENNIVVNWGKKKNVLLGHLYVHLKDGCGIVGDIRIKQDRNHLKNVKFRLGAMVVDCPVTYVVEEAITNMFEVKDKHILPKRLRPLSLEDKVRQLMNISHRRTSLIYLRLKSENIETVKEFLAMHSSNPRKLQEMCGIKGKKWEDTVNHAKTSLTRKVSSISTSQQSNTLSSGDSIDLFDDCYRPQPCDDEPSSLSINDFEICDVFFNVPETSEGNEGGGMIAKKRWMKLRIFFFLIVNVTKKVEK